jgi:hypothetical protein
LVIHLQRGTGKHIIHIQRRFILPSHIAVLPQRDEKTAVNVFINYGSTGRSIQIRVETESDITDTARFARMAIQLSCQKISTAGSLNITNAPGFKVQDDLTGLTGARQPC